MSEQKLTARQRLFVKEYLIDLNATQAAIRAGYSPRSAAVTGARMLNYAKVTEAIEAAQAERGKRLDITADRVLQELAVIGFADLSEYVEYGPEGVTIKSSKDVDGRAVAEVTKRSTQFGSTVSIKLHDKVAALHKLGQHLGLFREKVEVSGKDGGPVQVQALYLPLSPAEARDLAIQQGLIPADERREEE